MPKKPNVPEPEHSLVLDVLNGFLANLEKDPEVGPDAAKRLRKILLESQDTSAEVIIRALFPDETLT